MNSLENPNESAESISGPQKTTFRGSPIVHWATVVAWMGLIFYLSAQSRLPNVVPYEMAANPGCHWAFDRVCGPGRALVVGITRGWDSSSVSLGARCNGSIQLH